MPRLAWISMILGALLLIGAPVAWFMSEPEATVGDLDALTMPASITGAEDTGPDTTREPDVGSLPPTAPDEEQAASPEPEPEAEPVSEPIRIGIDAIGVGAPVVPVGLEDDGGMEIPEDITTVGWYELGVAPGEATGTAVISGHVDSREQGRGAFWDLRRLDVDDIVTLDHEDGSTSDWRVVARTSYPKEELPISDIFTRFGPPRLVLITCDGDFDRAEQSYADNVVVYTVPVEEDLA